MQVTQKLEALEMDKDQNKGGGDFRTRRLCTPTSSTLPHSYLQVVTFLHIEVQPVLQLFQVPGLLQDTLPLAKSLQPACLTAKNHHDKRLSPALNFSVCCFGGRVRWALALSSMLGGPKLCLTASAVPIPIMVVLLDHTDAPWVEMDSEEV